MQRIGKVALVVAAMALVAKLVSKGHGEPGGEHQHPRGPWGLKEERRAKFEAMARQWHRREHERGLDMDEGSSETA